ncbi:hypothetical protein CYMTET_19006 [Cymbomonas tetramitiformis]|uniref:Uncharacterized protein n=1 Tax=Cymbomonas tetramitiformis TaxID=36881 RepID=A0AAE0G700_9CHLO|nr:hypothetical protein CYMTET_19006 [Cymbomonas tetramitiformis]
MDTFSFPKREQDWEKFCECFPQATDESELRSLLKAGQVLPKIQCKNEHDMRKFQFEDKTTKKDKKRYATRIAEQIQMMPPDIKTYWNSIERAVLAKIKSTTAGTAAYNLKDLQGAYLGFTFHLCTF